MFKNFNLKNWKTTLLGGISTLMFALISFGIISADQASVINGVVSDIMAHAGPFWPTLGWITYGISSIILLFAGDPPSPKKEAGVSKWKGIFR